MPRSTPQYAPQSAFLCACATAIVVLSGCASTPQTSNSGSMTTSIPQGMLHGGAQPIVGAHVYAYTPSQTGGYGSASSSLMQPGAGTVNDGTNNYVITNASGGFSYAGTILCPTPSSPVYLLALGGNGNQPAPVNSAIALMASLGSCNTINSATYTVMNEVTTAAMAYALQSFTTDPTHIGSPASNTAGLLNSFATIANIADSTTGQALVATPSGDGVAPQAALNTIANIASPCANSVSSTSAACSSLFSHASTSLGTPTTVFAALLNIAAFPASQVAGLFSDSLPVGPFQPALSTPPNDFSLGITFLPPSLTPVQPNAVVIDVAGNIWMANCQSCLIPGAPDSLIEFSPTGLFLHSYTGSSNPFNQILHNIKGIAIESTGTYIYTINQGRSGGSDQLIKMATASGAVQTGFPVTFSPGTYGTDTFEGIAIDNSDQIWATAPGAGAVVELAFNGSVVNGGPYFVGGTLGVATDNIGNIWFAGIGGNNILQFDTNGNFLNNFTPSGVNQPQGMAINGSNELWTINNGTQRTVSRIEFYSGLNGSGSPYPNLGIFKATTTAIDGASQVVIPNCRGGCPGSGSTAPDSLLRLTQSGDPNTGGPPSSSGVQVPGFHGLGGAAIDASGNVWVSNSVTGTLTEVLGFAAPTNQPLALASSNGTIGQLP